MKGLSRNPIPFTPATTPDPQVPEFFFWRNFIKFWPDKYDFDLSKWFSIVKITQIRQISVNFFPDLQIFMIISSR